MNNGLQTKVDPWADVVAPAANSSASFFLWGKMGDGESVEVTLTTDPVIAKEGVMLRSKYALAEFEGTLKGDKTPHLFAVSSKRLFARLVPLRPVQGDRLRITAVGPPEVAREWTAAKV